MAEDDEDSGEDGQDSDEDAPHSLDDAPVSNKGKGKKGKRNEFNMDSNLATQELQYRKGPNLALFTARGRSPKILKRRTLLTMRGTRRRTARSLTRREREVLEQALQSRQGR